MSLLVLVACGPAVVGFPGEGDGGRETGTADTEPGDTSGDTGGPDDTADTAADTADTVPDTADTVADTADTDCEGEPDGCADGTDVHAAEDAGWTVVGVSGNDGVGSGGVLTAGDLDRDGWPELVVAAPLFGATDAGAVAVHGADTAALGVPFDEGRVVSGAAAGDRFGSSLELLGDLDGDGWDDLLAGAPLANGAATDGGAAWIFDLSEGAGTVSEVARGEVTGGSRGGLLGSSVAAGDLDGDGLPELVIGAPGVDAGRGRVYVGDGDDAWWDRSGTTEGLDAYVGVDAGDALGTAVAATEDLDGDGYGDLLACGPGADDAGTDAGACWLVSGRRDEEVEGEDIAELATATFTGAAAGDAVGYGQSSLVVADLDGDGAFDLALGAPGWDGPTVDGGAVAAWWGGALEGSYDLDGADVFVVGDGALGRALAPLADYDGDGAPELLVGAPTAAEGTLYLLNGLGAGGRLDASSAAAAWTGATAGDAFASTIGALADVDGDGTPNFAASAPASDTASGNAGTTYVLSP